MNTSDFFLSQNYKIILQKQRKGWGRGQSQFRGMLRTDRERNENEKKKWKEYVRKSNVKKKDSK